VLIQDSPAACINIVRLIQGLLKNGVLLFSICLIERKLERWLGHSEGEETSCTQVPQCKMASAVTWEMISFTSACAT